ncbi:unnamed protein product [Diabrotica balteata]|uniref:RAP domain-containing protein n=1 Tax=Diabrotica balteata TaxID=107213 RepID=A0A9N9T527_DIABA|nr:unnamed protein product [Diabrotica balteata]
MKIFRIFRSFQSKSNFKRYLNSFTHAKINRAFHKQASIVKQYTFRQYSTENDESEDYPFLEAETLDQIDCTKYILFKDSEDAIIRDLNECRSLKDVWNVFNNYKTDFKEKHVAQTIFVLKDLQNLYCRVNCSVDSAFLNYLNEMKQSEDFSNLMNMISEKLCNFNAEVLSYIFLYLHKLGIHIEDFPMVQIAEKIKRDLIEEFNISNCSKWIKVIFLENGSRPYYMSLELMPKIFNAIDECDSVEQLADISTCLTKLQNIVTPQIVSKYIDKVQNFIEHKKLTSMDHNAVLKVITFLSCPGWRNQNTVLLSKCMLLLKNQINRLDATRLLVLYEVFFKTQEPGDLLNEIQRCAAKYWQQHEESNNLDNNTALKLFSSLIYFNSPLHRIHVRKDIEKLLKDQMSPSNLSLLRKIFSYVKISDNSLCHDYWQMWSNILNEDSSMYLLVMACQNYMQFNTDIDNYRNNNFEKKVLFLIRDLVRSEELLFPQDLTVLLTFVMLYGRDKMLLEILLGKLKDNPRQLKGADLFTLSKFIKRDNLCLSERQYKDIQSVFRETSEHLLNENDFETKVLLVKSAILRNEYDNYQMDTLITEFKEMNYMSSKFLEHIHFIFMTTSTLVPEVFNKMTEYIINNKNNIVGFNAEKLLFLCFHLAYLPINADKFFQTVTDIIIRDQERLSGLAFLQSALSLSFFNKLPSFLVKQIFNVEFMDRLDNELANCYSKEKYPQRVRQTLMYLNRSVCLEYPEFNVPWFHEKYLKDIRKTYNNEMEYTYSKSIKEYLVEIAENHILESITTPYGYYIDFVISLNKEDCVVSPSSKSISKRVALLLVHQYAFTRFYSHLRGTYQMKIRHLEIMGYSVSIMKIDEWTNLLYASERIEYLKKLIWPDNWNTIQCLPKR